jgi:hypothetical protein
VARRRLWSSRPGGGAEELAACSHVPAQCIWILILYIFIDQIPNLQSFFTTPVGLRQISTCCQVPVQVNF